SKGSSPARGASSSPPSWSVSGTVSQGIRAREEIFPGGGPSLDLVLAQLDVVELGVVEPGPDVRRERVALVGERVDCSPRVEVLLVARGVARDTASRRSEGVHREGPEGSHQLLVHRGETLDARMVHAQADRERVH